MITPENHNEENHNQESEENRKTIYKETQDDREDEKDAGDSSSVGDIGRTDFARRAERKHNPLGSSHEPGSL
ncbi:hypothetical protein [Pedobacter sp.]|uniref:hypothetical protein n=1 Tax=Pedobacter sp. TaxID=1411316 RepID=UPI003D7FB10B